MTPRRFEFRDDTSAKFWEIEAVDHRTITTWGRIGTNGQTKAKEFGSAEKAAADATKKIAEKVKKGYAEIGDVVEATPTAPATPATAPPPVAAQPPAAPSPPPVAAPSDAATVDFDGWLGEVVPVPEPEYPGVAMPSSWWHKVLPRRGEPSADRPLSPKPQPDIAATALAIEYKRKQPLYADSLSKAALDPRVAHLMADLPSEVDAADEAHVAAFSLAARVTSTDRSFDSFAHHVVDNWLATAGFAFTLRTVEAFNWWQIPRGYQTGTLHRGTGFVWGQPDGFCVLHGMELLSRLRHHLALANEADYAAARVVGDEIRQRGDTSNWRMAFVFPTETAWVDAAIDHIVANQRPANEVSSLGIVGSSDQLDRMLAVMGMSPRVNRWVGNPIATLLSILGASLVPYLGTWISGQVLPGKAQTYEHDADTRKAYARALHAIGNDQAMAQLARAADHKHVLPSLTDLANERPHLAVRGLAPLAHGSGATAKAITTILRTVVREHPGAVAEVARSLSDQERSRVLAFGDRSDEKPTAPDELIHSALVDPPWNNRADQSTRTIVTDLTPIVPAPRLGLTTSAGEQVRGYRDDLDAVDWQLEARQILANEIPDEYSRLAYLRTPWFFSNAPVDVIKQMMHAWALDAPDYKWELLRGVRALVARLGNDSVPALEVLAQRNLSAVIDVVDSLASTGLAMPFADAFRHKKSMRARAAEWLDRNADIAAHGLIPVAVGPSGADQVTAANTLHHLGRSQRDTIEAAAAQYPADVQQAVAEILDFDELQVLPKRMPKAPDFLSLLSMTLPQLADRQNQLSAEAAANLLTMLALCKPGEPYPGVALVVPTLDPTSTAAFAWKLFEAWRTAGMPSKHGWILTALGHLGNDDTVRQLTPILRAWPGEGGHKRAVSGLDALATIGTDLALMQLFSMSRKLKFKGLKNKAAEKVQQIAEARDLTADQLADRLVPDLDLDERGSLTLDYGERSFTVGFDEQLKPFVRDDSGKIRKALPKPAQKDDPELAPLAYKRFSALKKDARAVAADQLIRLEQAMVRQRRWTSAEFTEYFVSHPLIIHLVRRLVWGQYVDGSLVATFRVAEDRSLADANDDAFVCPDEAVVGIVHPLDVDEGTLAAWGEVLSDYEMLQPFEQVARQTFAMTPDELDSSLFTRFNGPSLPFGSYLGLEKKGWTRGAPQDGGVSPNLYRQVADDAVVHVELEEGLWTGYIQETPDQPIRGVWIGTATNGTGWYNRGDDPAKFSTLDPVAISELLRDLTALFADVG